jgi:hypothetical protein
VSAINNIANKNELERGEKKFGRTMRGYRKCSGGKCGEKRAAVVDRVSWRCPAFVEAENASGIGFPHMATNGETRTLYRHF